MRRTGSETRREIIQNAMQLFTLKGYNHTSINDLLAATNLTKGGLYGHFKSKEEIWNASYAGAVDLWKGIVFRGVHEIDDPLERIQRVIEQDLRDYVGGRVFTGGCFFFNLLVELSGQAPEMSGQILRGFDAFSTLLAKWLTEARERSMVADGVNPREVADFLVVALNGATAIFSARMEPEILEGTIRQLRRHIDDLRICPC